MNEQYKLPEGWRWVRLGEVCEVIMGQSPPGHTYSETPIGVPFFQGKADFGDYFPTVRVWCNHPIKIAEEGDILISVRAPVGPVNMSNLKCCIGRGLAAIRCRNISGNWYIFWYLRSLEPQMSLIGSGSTFNAITCEDLCKIPIPLPPLSVQRRIVAKIKEMMDEVERTRTACEKQLEAVKTLPSAYLRQVFESEEAKKWERKKLGEVCEYCQYGLTATATDDESGIPYLRITDIDDWGNLKLNNLKYVICDDSTYKKYALRMGDILFARSGSIGRTFLYNGIPEKAVFASYLIRFKLSSNIEPYFLFYYTHSPMYYKFIESVKHTVSQPNINAGEYKSLFIPLPPLSVQRRIVAELKEKMADVEKLRLSIEKQLETINALPQAILRKAFRGEL